MKPPILLLDGGMGQELMRRSTRPPEPLWSARTVEREPEIVIAAHADFIAAGARVITVSSYAATPQRLAEEGEADRFEALQRKACELALRARDRSGVDVAIAGCLPPLVRSYRPDLAPSPETMAESYARIVAAQAGEVDLFVCETLASLDEIIAAVGAARAAGIAVWTGVTVQDGDGTRLRSGVPVEDAARVAAAAGADAVLVNCSSPEAVSDAMRGLAAAGKPFGGLPNGFVSVAPQAADGVVTRMRARDDLSPARFVDFALAWADAGATLLGGCCEIGPSHLAALRDRLKRDGVSLAPPPLRDL